MCVREDHPLTTNAIHVWRRDLTLFIEDLDVTVTQVITKNENEILVGEYGSLTGSDATFGLSTNKGIPGAVIGVLRECQGIVGYLPVELIDQIGRGLNLSQSEVFGVASFYALFSLEPKGRNLIKVCLGTACYVKGIKEVITRIENQFKVEQGGTSPDRRFSLEPVRCLGACGLAPVMVVNEHTYGNVKPDNVVKVLQKYE